MDDLISRKAVIKALLAERDKHPPVVNGVAFHYNEAIRGGIRKALRIVETIEGVKYNAELEQVKRERDAAVHDLIPSCAICVHNRGLKKWDDECNDCYDKSNWQWRGVNGKGE